MAIKFKETPLAWAYYGETLASNGTRLTISGMFRARDEAHAEVMMERRLNEGLRKPELWFGSEVTLTPLSDSQGKEFIMKLSEPTDDDVESYE